jgi:hypothetical protein
VHLRAASTDRPLALRTNLSTGRRATQSEAPLLL